MYLMLFFLTMVLPRKESIMSPKRFFQNFILSALLLSFFVLPQPVMGGTGVCGDRVTVASGDTLRKIADRCGTSVNALKLANEIKDVNAIKVGQVLLMPGALIDGTGGNDIYIVNHRDTLGLIAKMFKTTVSYLLKLNPTIKNANLIYAGQRLNVPETGITPQPTPTPKPTQPTPSGQTYIVKKGDTMYKIAALFKIPLTTLVKANPQVVNISKIYIGQKINIPAEVSTYIVVKGDTLKKIADRFGTTWQILLKLNPQIKNANLIYVGQIITLP
jgi:LysM repeat protein